MDTLNVRSVSTVALISPIIAAALLGKSDEALNHYRTRNTGPSFVRLGNRPGAPVGYTREAIAAFAAAKKIKLVEMSGDLIDGVSIENTRILASGRGSALNLSSAFYWTDTPQGHDYWQARAQAMRDGAKLTLSDLTFIRALLARAEVAVS